MSMQAIAAAAIQATPGANTQRAATAGAAAPTPAHASSAAALAQGTPPHTEGALWRGLVELEKALAPIAHDLQLSVDDHTGKTVIKIIDSTTDEVIKQFPSEDLLAVAKAISTLQGVLSRQQV